VKIIFLSTGRGMRPEVIQDLREKLSLRSSDVVCLVSWHPPRHPLPVDRHLVLGPELRLAGDLATVHRVQRRPELFAAADESLRVEKLRVTTPSSPTAPADPTGSASPTDPASPTDAASPAGTSSPPRTAGAPRAAGVSDLPVYDPRRVRKAIAWRARRLKKAARTHTPSAVPAVRAHPLFRKARNWLSPGVSLGFAASCLRSGKVHAMARDTDLVVALDAASHRGAWTLAQRIEGPHVVIGIPAAQHILKQRDESAPS
jgi:hypothetical protein